MGGGLHVELLGHFQVTYDGRPVTGVHARQQTLLTYLLLNPHRHSRQQVAALFWPDSGDGQSMTNLRRELHNLRHALPDADRLLSIDQVSVGLREARTVSCDVFDFESAVGRGDRDALRAASALYKGDLLPDCGDAWIVSERERLRQKYAGALRTLVALLEEGRDYAEAIEHARRLLALEPFDEQMCRTLMRLHALRGERGAVRDVYLNLTKNLEVELGVKPDPETVEAYERVRDTAGMASASEVTRATVPPLVGRGPQWSQILRAWHDAERGQAKVVVIRGEAGIGKTRLAEELLDWCGRQGIAGARTRSFAAEGGLPYAPITDWLRSKALEQARARLEAPWRNEVALLVPEFAPQQTDPGAAAMREPWRRQRLFEGLSRAVLCGPRPMLLVLDDLQWCDLDTLEWVRYHLGAHATDRLLVVGTLRSEEATDNRGLGGFLQHLRSMERLAEIDVGPLDAAETALLAAHVAGSNLDPERRSSLYRQTEGHPLFIVEIARSGVDARLPLSPKIQAIIDGRLARLSPMGREVARLAAVVGRDFSIDLLREAAAFDERVLTDALDELWQRRIIRDHGVTGYDFSHDRVRESAYAEIAPATRQRLHRRIAGVLEHLHADNLDPVSARVAAHCEHAGDLERARRHYRRAAEVAARVFAHEEAIRHVTKALGLLKALPETEERDRDEIGLQLALSVPMLAAKGYTSVELEATLERVRTLGGRIGDAEAGIEAQSKLFGVHVVRGNLAQSLTIARDLLTATEGRPGLIAQAHLSMAGVSTHLGELDRARHHFEQALSLYDRQRSQAPFFGLDIRVFSLAWGAHVWWMLGFPDRALRSASQAVTYAEELGHPHNLAVAHAYAIITSHLCGDLNASAAHSSKAAALCGRYGIGYYAEWSTIFDGWSQAVERPADGIATIRRGLGNLAATNSAVRRPLYLSLLANALVRAEQREEARGVLDAALATAAANGELWWAPELHRLRGLLDELPEPWFLRALEIARSQSSRSLELRVAMSLARVWRDQGQAERGRALLSDVYGRFTEGHGSADLTEARTLLTDL
jgi:DNA-binding SARP family transcriptional activator/predicted ATPase